MMVDLDDDPEWSIQDDVEDEDEERFVDFDVLFYELGLPYLTLRDRSTIDQHEVASYREVVVD